MPTACCNLGGRQEEVKAHVGQFECQLHHSTAGCNNLHQYTYIHLLHFVHTYIHTYMHTYIHTYIHTYVHTLGAGCLIRGYSLKQPASPQRAFYIVRNVSAVLMCVVYVQYTWCVYTLSHYDNVIHISPMQGMWQFIQFKTSLELS